MKYSLILCNTDLWWTCVITLSENSIISTHNLYWHKRLITFCTCTSSKKCASCDYNIHQVLTNFHESPLYEYTISFYFSFYWLGECLWRWTNTCMCGFFPPTLRDYTLTYAQCGWRHGDSLMTSLSGDCITSHCRPSQLSSKVGVTKLDISFLNAEGNCSCF